MSTKIYAGYRVRLDKLHLAIEWFRIAMWRRVVAVASPHVTTYEDVKAWRENYAECGFHVWIDGDRGEALIALFGLPVFTEPRRSELRWMIPRWIEEFSYWNNTDPPHGMRYGAGYRRWVARGAQWDRVALDGDRWDARLTQIVLSRDGYQDVALANECIAKFRKAWRVPVRALLSRRPFPRVHRVERARRK